MISKNILLLSTLLICATLATCGEENPVELESAHLKNIRRLTFVGAKNGEAYFRPDGKSIVFQGVREEGNPFYQIYTMDLATGKTTRVSPGTGKTTCSFFNPVKNRIIFASTHLDPESVAKQKAEIEKQKAGPGKRYVWDFDPAMDIFESDPDGKNLVRLTDAKGYDAECSYSPDGKQIVFCSTRDGDGSMNDGEIYIMNSDGKNQRRLTHEKGYDGGPFFSPDGKKIVWRHFEDDAQKIAEVWTMNADGSNKFQVTKLKAVSWAPYYHPSMKWIVFASNFEDPAFEIYAIRPDGKDLTRLTCSQGFDGLPVPSPDGKKLMWTSNRSENKSHIFIADLILPDVASEPTFPEPKGDDELFSYPKMTERLKQLQEAAAEFHVEHNIAKQFHAAGLVPFGVTENVEDTFFIFGPRITGWLPPMGAATSVIVAAADMQGLSWTPFGVAALAEGIKAEKNTRTNMKKTDEPSVSGIYFTVANADEVDSIYKSAQSDMKKPGAPSIAAFISVMNLGRMRGNTLYMYGTGTGANWRELAERLAAMHPELRIETVDSPEEAPELKQFTDNKIPAIAFGGPDIPPDQQDAAPPRDEYALIAATSVVGDTLRLLASGEPKITFTAYDAAAAKAAADAAKRPYLGTIPEYKSEGIVGVKLTGVRDPSPALKAGLKAGDIVIELGGMAVKDVEGYLKALEALKAGQETTLKYMRDGKTETVTVTLGAR